MPYACFRCAKLCLAAVGELRSGSTGGERYATLMLHLFCQMCCRSDPITAFVMLVVSPGFDLSEHVYPELQHVKLEHLI